MHKLLEDRRSFLRRSRNLHPRPVLSILARPKINSHQREKKGKVSSTVNEREVVFSPGVVGAPDSVQRTIIQR